VQRSWSLKCISIIVWKTLSRSTYVDERLAWDGVESEEDILFTPSKDDASLIDVSDNKFHLEVNGVVNSYIVNQSINHLNLFPTLGFFTPKYSTPQKRAQTCTKIIKVEDRKHHNVLPIPSSDHGGQYK